jgi:magnesium chelatase family protein
LSGELRPVRGALAMAQALHQEGSSAAMVLPAGSAQEAALVPGTRVYSVKQLQDVLQALSTATHAAQAWQPLQVQTQLPQECTFAKGDLQDVKGHAGVKRALEVAAAGGHSLLLVGPPGAGKSMLAQRLVGLLPPLHLEQALQTAAIHSIYSPVGLAHWGQRPYRHPHHSASLAALVGGGVPPRPGEISLAHHGVLFLDEFPEFSRAALEALRVPLETGIINLSRARHHVTYPAEFQLVAAMNPCPCGYLGMQKPSCRCSPLQVARYQGRISGPLWDRIDMQVSVNALSAEVLLHAPLGERTSVVKARCVAAHERAWARQGCRNKDLAQAQLQALVLSPEASRMLANAAEQRAWSARATHRVLRLAQTIADLAQAEEIGHMHMAEALQYRSFLT